MKATIATGEFDVIGDGTSVQWVSKAESTIARLPAPDSPDEAPLRGLLNAVILGSLLWLFLGAAVWFLV